MGHATTLWIASGNVAKSQELVDHSKKYLSQFKTVKIRPAQIAEESATTYLGNSATKAFALVQELLGEGQETFAVLGDDSGLSVDLLGGQPGIFSARYSGAGSNSVQNRDKVLGELSLIKHDFRERQAKYHCALSLIEVQDSHVVGTYTAEGVLNGLIGLHPVGDGGYAYDSIFLDPISLRSYAETSYDEKQKDSHRTRAFASLKQTFQKARPS